MISKNTINMIKNIIKPIADSGAIPESEYKEIIKRLRVQPEQQKQDKVELMTRQETSSFLKISNRQLDRILQSGKLNFKKFSRKMIRIKKSDLINFVESI